MSKLTKDELIVICRQMGITGYSNKNKNDIILLIIDKTTEMHHKKGNRGNKAIKLR